MLVTLARLVDGLVVYPENMARNLGLSLGMWNSQTVLLALIKKGLTRERAYQLVQDNAMRTWASVRAEASPSAGRQKASTGRRSDFLAELQKDHEVSRHFKPGELGKLCSLDFHFRQINARFRQLGL
jgi:adenylosuccinate lyase